jgi:hypothetical protein
MTRPGRKLSEQHRARISATQNLPHVKGKRITRLRETNERRKGPRWVEDENGCWLWQWALTANGYPSQGQRHAIYLLYRGPYPRGHQLNHLCGVRHCVNPDHQVPLSVQLHAALHVVLRRHGFNELPVPERIELSRRVLAYQRRVHA